VKWYLPYGTGDDVETFEFDDSRLTAAEARLQKRLTEGATPTKADALRLEGDPDALTAALVIARRRAGLDDMTAVQVDADALDIVAVIEATFDAAKKAVKAAHDEPKPPRRTRRTAKAADEPITEPSAA
jgi:hypothetical protein